MISEVLDVMTDLAHDGMTRSWSPMKWALPGASPIAWSLWMKEVVEDNPRRSSRGPESDRPNNF